MGVVRRIVALGLALAAGSASAAPAPVASPAPRTPSPNAGLLAGFDSLEDPADRLLPLVGRPRVFVPPRAGRAPIEQAREWDSREREARDQLGPGWRLEPLGGGPGAWVLRGPAVRLAEGTGFGALRGIVSRLPALFGPAAEASLEPVFDRSLGPSGVVRMRQRVDGARVAGGDVIASFDANGGLVLLASSYRTDLDSASGPWIAPDDAAAIARADLIAAFPGITIVGVPRAESWIWPLPSGAARIWIVRHATRDPWGSFVTRIDAATGAVLARENAVQSKTRTGDGIVYKSNADYPHRASHGKITALLGSDLDPAGHLDGMHITVLDEKGSRVASTDLRYRYFPFEDWDGFDQVSAYYHLQRAHERFQKKFGVSGLPWFDGPEPVVATANVRGLCDAFYTTDLAGDGKPGFAFGDQTTCEGLNNDDFARDSDVVYHEYTHAIVDWAGIGLQQAPVNSYQRALAEADADYHAAEFTGDPTIGEVVRFPRTIANTKVYPANVGCSFGFPEEHCTSLIWSGLLWDLRETIPGAEALEFASLDYLIDHPAASHVPVWLDFWDAAMALFDADDHRSGGRNVGIIYGLAASRGTFGPSTFGDDQLGFVYQDMQRGSRFKSIGWLGSSSTRGVPFYFQTPAGSTVSIKVKSTSGLHPDFLVGEAIGYPLEYFTAASAKDARVARLVTELPPVEGLYVVTVRSADATTGSFQISLVVEK